MSRRFHVAVGSCVLSAGLMIVSGGGAIATAAPDSNAGGTASQGQSADGPGHTASPGGPVGKLADSFTRTVQATVQGVTGTLNSLAKLGQNPTSANTGPTPPTVILNGEPVVPGVTSPGGASSTDPATNGAAADPAAADVDAITPVQVTSPLATSSDDATTVTNPAPSTPVAIAPVTDPPATSSWFGPVSNAFVAVVNSVVAVPGVVLSFPTSATPVADIVTSIQNVLVSVAGAGTSLAQVPSDLTALLGVTATTPPTIGGAAGHRFGPATTTIAPALAATAPSLSQLLLPGSVATGDGAGVPTMPENPAEQGVTTGLSAAAVPTMSQTGDTSNGTLSTVERVIGAFVASLSIAALAAMALPGVGGLLATCALGARIGYRQAKVGATQPAVMQRFAGSGPLGVVRAGSQVELHSRTSGPRASRVLASRPHALRIVGKTPAPVHRLLEEAV